MDLEDLGSIRRIKLEQCVQLCQFENDANQVKKSLKYLGNLQKNGQFSKNMNNLNQDSRVFKIVINIFFLTNDSNHYRSNKH